MTTPAVSVSVVAYRTPTEVLQGLLQSLRREPMATRITLVDNSPTQALKSWSGEQGLEYVFPGSNLGYGAAHNLGTRLFPAPEFPYHLVVNPDVQWNSPVLPTLTAYLDSNPDTALVAPKVLYPGGTLQYSCRLLPTPFDFLLRRFMPPGLFTSRKQRYELRFSGHSRDMNVPYLSGCFMLFRRSAFDEIGGFDERFFLYPEDADVTRRLHRRWRTMYVPAVSVFHAHGGASPRSLGLFLIHAWNVCRYFNKWGWFFDPERKRINAEALRRLASGS